MQLFPAELGGKDSGCVDLYQGSAVEAAQVQHKGGEHGS